MNKKKNLILATYNKNKVKEIKELFKTLPIEILSLNSFDQVPIIIENSDTFEGNAIKKAETVCNHFQVVTMADDSGLEVDILNGRPGVISARYAGKNATDKKNNAKLLKELENIPEEQRKACFRCVIAITVPGGKTITVEGKCHGRITLEPRGNNGFGYDPLFIYEPLNKTFAELDLNIKNEISHRGKALKKAIEIIKDLFGD